MKFNALVHHRHSTRLEGYDYTLPGVYYVTIIALRRECVFGEIEMGEMRMSKIGMIVRNEWERLPRRFTNMDLDLFTVMPNHLHGILVIGRGSPEGDIIVTAPIKSPSMNDSRSLGLPQVSPGSLGAIVRAFKSSATIRYNRILSTSGANLWQRNYHERIIRNEGELAHARAYIKDNLLRWSEDLENPTNMMGD